jgi:hypothetical protein
MASSKLTASFAVLATTLSSLARDAVATESGITPAPSPTTTCAPLECPWPCPPGYTPEVPSCPGVCMTRCACVYIVPTPTDIVCPDAPACCTPGYTQVTVYPIPATECPTYRCFPSPTPNCPYPTRPACPPEETAVLVPDPNLPRCYVYTCSAAQPERMEPTPLPCPYPARPNCTPKETAVLVPDPALPRCQVYKCVAASA